MSTSRPRMSTYPGHANAQPERLPWPRALVRMFLVVLPGQLVGTFLGALILGASGVLRDRPGLAVLITVLAGLAAGLIVGLVLRPDRDQLVGYALAAAAIGVVAYLLLFGLAQLRLPESTPRAPFATYIRGPLLAALAQSAVAVPLWLLRIRGRS